MDHTFTNETETTKKAFIYAIQKSAAKVALEAGRKPADAINVPIVCTLRTKWKGTRMIPMIKFLQKFIKVYPNFDL